MDSEINIRLANNLDISELLRLAWDGYKEMAFYEEGVEYDPHMVGKLMLSIIQSGGSRGVIYVADHPKKEGKIIGRIMLFKDPIYHNPSFVAVHVIGLNVDKKWRGKGIGKRLINEAEVWAKQAGSIMMTMQLRHSGGDKVKAMYEGLGFKPVETMYYKMTRAS